METADEIFKLTFFSIPTNYRENGNGRLGLSSVDHSQSTRRLLIAGGLPLPTRLSLPSPPVSLTATGFAFSALTTTGQLLIWGTLDGSIYSPRSAPLSHPGREVSPRLAPKNVGDALGEVRQVEGGRKHLVLRNGRGEVWEMRSWGRAGRVVDEEGRWGSASGEGGEVVGVDAGWEHSTVLTRDGRGFVMYEPGSHAVQQLAEEAGEATSGNNGVAFEIRTHTVQLPPLPSAPARRSSAAAQEKLVLLASGQNFVLGLSTTHSVYHLDLSPVPDPVRPALPAGALGDHTDSPTVSRASRERLAAAFVSGQRSWTRLDQYSDLDGDALAPVWDAAGVTRPTAEARVTHISAHFNSFAVYAVPPTDDPAGSYVLLGSNPSDPPSILPELQNRGVIKIAQGDYHTLALTSAGALFSWGAYSNGALGLGHPQLYEGALAKQSRPEQEESTVLPHRQIMSPPERVERPTRVVFRGEGEEGGGKFVFGVAASGWHSGCLAVDRVAHGEETGQAEGSGQTEPTIFTPGSDDEGSGAGGPPIPHHDNTPPPGWAAADGSRAVGRGAGVAHGEGVMGPVGAGIGMGLAGARMPRFRVGYAGRGRVPLGRGGMIGRNPVRGAEE